MTDHGFAGLAAYQKSKAIGALISIVPLAPLILSDELGFQRGWLWLAWSAIAIIWFAVVWTVILTAVFRDASRQWKKRR